MKACIACEHFSIDMGEDGYSELTPGYPGRIECMKGRFSPVREGIPDVMPDLVDKATDCPKYQITDEAKKRGFTP